MLKKNTVRLPAVTVEIPRMGNIVYVSDRVGVQDNKWTAMFTAEIAVNGHIELQSFHLKCNSEKEAQTTAKEMSERLAKYGSFPFIQNSL